MSSEDEHRLARWQLTARFNNVERNSPIIERREENVCFLNSLLHVKAIQTEMETVNVSFILLAARLQ